MPDESIKKYILSPINGRRGGQVFDLLRWETQIYIYKALFCPLLSHVLFVPPCHRGKQESDKFPEAYRHENLYVPSLGAQPPTWVRSTLFESEATKPPPEEPEFGRVAP